MTLHTEIMAQPDKINMMINIGAERMQLTVPFNEQDNVRDTERHISDLYRKWREMYPSRTPGELTAMLAYQYASFYLAMKQREDQTSAILSQLEQRIDKALTQ